MPLLNNKVALLTGAASGIGRATALLFSEEGAALALADLNDDGLKQLEQTLRAKGAKVVTQGGDISSESMVRKLVEETIASFGHLDVLFNNAGIDLQARIEETSEADWDRIMGVNVKAMFLLAKHVVPHMIRVGGGSIINVASATALIPVASRPAYNASKGAVVALTKSLALDLAANNIRANCICPGAVNTPLVQGALAKAPDPKVALAGMMARYPLGRLAEPEEIARVVLFLASSHSSYMTGATLAVDGGRTMH
jgi:NAD(P)-dependent dehydrogenase (short-subunit alcohol dehydrogenase family)